MVVYQITVNNKKYVGKYNNCNSNEEFQKSNYWGGGIYIANAIKKYGIQNAKKKVILHCNPEDGSKYEILWIKKLNTKSPNGYNLTDGGEGFLNPTQEVKQKRIEHFLQTWASFTEEKRKEMKEKFIKSKTEYFKTHHGSNKGRVFSEEVRQKQSLAKSGKPSGRKPTLGKHWKWDHDNPIKGQKRSEEIKLIYKKAQSNPIVRVAQSKRMTLWWEERKRRIQYGAVA
jgi:hypothetical protein